MNQKLLKISIIISLLGILVLIFISNLPSRLIEIKNINSSLLNQQVKIHGNITSIRKISNDFFLLTIKDSTGTITGTINKNFSSDSSLEITGLIEQYKNKTQIKINKINDI